jgi:protein ImuA
LQGISHETSTTLNNSLWFLKDAFPHGSFPLGAVHEFLAFNPEDKAASLGFISSVLSNLINNENICIWISPNKDYFPSALPAFSLCPDNCFFIRHHNEKELLWVTEEFLKYDQITAVVVEINSLDFTTSRRFQLAVEKSKVTAFVLRTDHKKICNNACVSRWQVKSIPSHPAFPGVGFPCWEINLQRMRNGKPYTLELECIHGKLQLLTPSPAIAIHHSKKAAG